MPPILNPWREGKSLFYDLCELAVCVVFCCFDFLVDPDGHEDTPRPEPESGVIIYAVAYALIWLMVLYVLARSVLRVCLGLR